MENKLALPPGPKKLPFLGNLLEFKRDQLSYLHELEQTYGRLTTIYIGKTPVVLFFRPEHIRYILTENPDNFTNREVAGGLIFGNLLILTLLARNFSKMVTIGLSDLLGDGLITIDGAFHRRERHHMQPAFYKRRVENYAGITVQYTREMLVGWQAEREIDITKALQVVILRIIMKILLDVDVADNSIELGRLIDDMIVRPIGLFEGLVGRWIDLPGTAHSRRMAAKRKADAFCSQFIDQRVAEKRDAGDVLSMLIQTQNEENGGALTKQQVLNEIVTLIAAGHETTTHSLAWTFYLLSEHPLVREKLLAELQTVLAGRDPTANDLPNLPYLEWVVKESMRIYPSAWTQGRRAIESFDLDGYHFPAGTLIMFSQWALHHLRDIWGDPEVFRPERWDTKNGQQAPQWAYFPFGGGSRICIGKSLALMEIRLVLATILQHFSPRLVPGYPVVPQPLITLRPKYGIRMKLELTPAPAERAAVGQASEGKGSL